MEEVAFLEMGRKDIRFALYLPHPGIARGLGYKQDPTHHVLYSPWALPP